MPKIGENIYLRRDGRWEGRFIYAHKSNGKARFRSVYGDSREAVGKKLAFLRGQYELRLKSTCNVTVKELIYRWLSDRFGDVKTSTYERYRLLAEKHIIPELGELAFNELTAEKLKAFLDQKKRSGRLDGCGGLAPKTVNDIHILLKSAIKYAVRKLNFQSDMRLSDIKLYKF